ncbi:multiheme c-type cytochrome [Stratiformator vulcanicus]|uniref:Cytochrome c-552/4 domain-containing protein n=1 Tax=Stratiformator vulcanicus TaxID=2527980 RepID=A0A517QX81_9PLAN|nr:multiheme c-type cytochrome [Stratiformator vulcanicus]QDT36193.1 hypothetical protein Pan189_05480 [Stratiformator vulcanicus]
MILSNLPDDPQNFPRCVPVTSDAPLSHCRRLVASVALSLLFVTPQLATAENAQVSTGSPEAENSNPKSSEDHRHSELLSAASSCSGRGCHGRARPTEGEGAGLNEFTLWQYRDPHTTAYAVLKSAESVRISELLYADRLSKDGRLPDELKPWNDVTCVACHGSIAKVKTERPDRQANFTATGRGISCDSCHVEPAKWMGGHVELASYQAEADRRAAYKNVGMPYLSDPYVAGETCAACHVGSAATAEFPARDVNHDLIAAGHPRLLFDLPTFLDAIPPHWRGKGPATNRLECWAAGQVTGSRAWIGLMKDRAQLTRADRDRPWPEFAESSCYGCHQDLVPLMWKRSESNGRPQWGNHFADLTGEAAIVSGIAGKDVRRLEEVLGELTGEMSRFRPEPDRVIELGNQADGLLAKCRIAKRPSNQNVIREKIASSVLDRLPQFEAWDGVVKAYFLIDALNQDRSGGSQSTELSELFQRIEINKTTGKFGRELSPVRFRFDRRDRAIETMRELLERQLKTPGEPLSERAEPSGQIVAN